MGFASFSTRLPASCLSLAPNSMGPQPVGARQRSTQIPEHLFGVGC